MAKNECSSTGEGRHQTIHLASVASGDMVLVGDEGLHGVAFIDTNAQGNTVIDIAGRWYLPIENEVINIGDALYCDDTGGTLSVDPAHGIFFGYALEEYAQAGSGASICVLVVQDHVLQEGELANFIGQADLKDEITYSQYICFGPAQLDDITVMAGDLESDCDVVHVSYWTSQALGTGLGIDLVDGGADGSGSAVIDSCADNLDGLDDNELSTPYAMLAGEVLKLTVDDVTNDTWIYVKVTLKVKLNEEP